VVLGLYWKGATSRAALASIAGAVGVTLTVSHFTQGEGLWLLSPQAIGIGTAFVILVVVSRVSLAANERE
jgi:SSS family solute:Na+ symporter